MPTIYVVDVPEFAPMVEEALKNPDCTVSESRKGYFRIDAPGAITFNRKAMKMKPAIWYGIFTGGLDGEIRSFGRDEVVVIGTNKSL
ncbi:hypothetical protein [Azospirillum sp. B21]|uniref:hypothetical protein n=1 Tax=Azospirillum sp. B21 TaxID=2607496 RepID=UPI001B3B4D3D|nr:hypothetical protein [Azospirillum sp. B21]